MKYLRILFFPIILISILQAQEKTLVGDKEVDNGGFGALEMKLTSLNDEGALLMGGKGGWIINHTFVIGAAGYGLVNNIPLSPLHTEDDYFLMMGYGGLYLEYIHNSDNLFHFTVHSLIGGGNVQHREAGYYNPEHYYNSNPGNFFVLEPGISAILNITSFFRLGIGLNYRYIDGIDKDGLNGKDLSGPSATLTFKFGSF